MHLTRQLMVVLLAALWTIAVCQAADPEPVQATAEATADAQPADDTVSSKGFPPEQIEQLVAPIALYPDALIAQMLMAATYPLDVVQASRWFEDNADLEGEDLEKAADAESWDPSVKTLVFFPDVLSFMSDNLEWTQDLGDAVLAQQDDVTNAIQKLRQDAQDAGNLETTDQQRVEAEGDTIIVQPADPEIVYVPTYTPSEVYGQSAPPETTYYPTTYTQPVTPVVISDSATTASSSSSSMVNFGVGALVGGLLTAAILWDNNDNRVYYGGRGYYGSPGYWGGSNYYRNGGWNQPRNINVDRNVNIDRNVERGDITVNKGIVGNDIKAGKWEHNPDNRRGVRYRDQKTKNHFAEVRKDQNLDRDTIRGRDPDRDRAAALSAAAVAPAIGAAALTGDQKGRLAKAGDSGVKLKDRAGDGGKLKDRAGDAGRVKDRAAAKPKAKQPAQKARQPAQKAKSRPKPAANQAKSRPANVKPKTKQAATKRSAPKAKPKARPKTSAQRSGKSSAFRPKKSNNARAASQRGGKSRSGGGQRGGGRRGRG